MSRGLDWPGLLRAGLQGLGLRPAEFWALTPVELMLMLGREPGQGALTRDRLGALMARFPDTTHRGTRDDRSGRPERAARGP